MFQAGWAKTEIAIEPRGYAMFGYGRWTHRARGKRTPLYARAVVIGDAAGGLLAFCCLDLGYVSWAMRKGLVERLAATPGARFDEESLVLTCTHTHSGPGGCSHEALYNFVTPGFLPDHVEAIVTAAASAILMAWENRAETEVGLQVGHVAAEIPVAWNRSIRAWNRNPDVTRYRENETNLALNRDMPLLVLRREGRVQAFISLFGVHATCLGNTLPLHDGDNKGYAAAHAEQALVNSGIERPVAIFAQATAGDVSPHYHGPGDIDRRAALRGEAEYAYAERNGRLQAEAALAALGEGDAVVLDGTVSGLLSYADFTQVEADARFTGGREGARTSDPCHGVAFFAGARVDGPGVAPPVAAAARRLARLVRRLRLSPLSLLSREERAYYRQLYASQGPKDILLETGRKLALGQSIRGSALAGLLDPIVREMGRQVRIGAVRESALVPTVLPLQLVSIGGLVIACCPGEITGTAGKRIVATVAEAMRAAGRPAARVLLCSYCNEYMGYVTTGEEYQEQAYEGGHTVFGQWTLAAFQTLFERLADQFARPAAERDYDRSLRPVEPPAQELALRSCLPVPD